MKKKIFVRAPCLSQSGYGEQARFALRALRSREDLFEIYIQPIPWGQTGWIWEENEFRAWMDSRITQTQVLLQQKKLNPNISLQITIPNEFQKICPLNIGYTAGIETNLVAPQWLQKGNEEVDKILVVSNHAKDTYESTAAKATTPDGKTIDYKLETPVSVGWESTPSSEAEEIPGFDLTNDFNYLIDQDVGLVLKTNLRNNSVMDLEAVEKQLKAILEPYPERKCKVSLLHGDLSSGQMTGLYTHPKIKAMINISHGEGFGLPLFEAAREGLPIITIGWSGQTDFLTYNNKPYFQKVNHQLKPVQPEARWEGVIRPDSQWAFADQGSYKMTLRKTFKKWEDCKETATELQGLLEENFNDEKLHKLFIDEILGFDSALLKSREDSEEEVMEFE